MTTSPDLLNDLHTLRALARDVKQTADTLHQWRIATLCAQVAEEATAAIDLFNHPKNPHRPDYGDA